MAIKVSNLQLFRGVVATRALIRVLLLVSAMAIYMLVRFVSNVDIEALFVVNTASCAHYKIFPGQYLKTRSFNSVFPLKMPSLHCEDNSNFTSEMLGELIDMQLLNPGSKVLCVGEGSAPAVSALRELGFIDAFGVDRHPFFSLVRKGFIYNLSFVDGSFDFVFSRAFDKVSIPALFTLEIERVLKPGGIGVMIMGASSSESSSLIKITAHLSAFLKSSDVIHVNSIGSSTMVVFKKGLDDFRAFEHYHLPYQCPSVMNSKPFMDHLEPLVMEKTEAVNATKDKYSYLLKFMNVSNHNRFVYIDIGPGEFSNSSISKWFLPYYPMPSLPFIIYALDHNTSVLSSYVGKPGINFIPYPGLAGKWVTADLDLTPNSVYPSSGTVRGFDFLGWLRETAVEGSFIVLKMNTEGVGLKLLHELFESGAICLINELFLHCTNNTDDQDATGGDCSLLFEGLRSSGIYVHQWYDD